MDDLQTPATSQADPGTYTRPNDADAYLSVDYSAVVPSTTNPRSIFKPGPLAELAEDIKAHGIMAPLLVRPLPAARVQETWTDRRKGDPLPAYEIVAGERRYRAAGLAALKKLPVLVRHLTDRQVHRMQLSENIQRQDLHPLEEARAYRTILDEPETADKPMKDRMAALAKEVGKSTRHIYQTLQLLKLCDFAQKVFLEEKLDKTVAAFIATIGNDAQQIEATRRCAGLRNTGESTEVINTPLHYRDAESYIRDNFRLVLSKAPFPVKVEFAGIGPCTTCDKMSANAQDLFAEGAKVPDTCMDPSCYSKKNSAHQAQVAKAAKDAGGRVITGAEARKIVPSYSPTKPQYNSGFVGLEVHLYGDDVTAQHSGKTVQQILGKDMPAPVLIERPDGEGFVKALPKSELKRLLKEKGVAAAARTSSASDSQKAAEAKAKRDKAFRLALAEKLLAEAGNYQAKGPAPAWSNHAALLSQLLLGLMGEAINNLDQDQRQRVYKLMGWAGMGNYPSRPEIERKLRALDALAFNRLAIAVCVTRELHVNQYVKPHTDALNHIASLLKVDAKQLKATMDAEAKGKVKKPVAKAPAKKPATTKASTKAAPKARKVAGPNLAFMKPLQPSPVLAAIVGAEPQPRTDIVSKLWKYVKKHQLVDATNKRLVNCDEKLEALFGKKQVSMFEMAGLLGKNVSTPKAASSGKTTTVRAAPTKDGERKPASMEAWADIEEVGDLDVLNPGERMRVKPDAKLSPDVKAHAGKIGTLSSRLGEAVSVKFDAGGKAVQFHFSELQFADPAPSPAAAKKGKAKSSTKPANQLELGGLDKQGDHKVGPSDCWPFPTHKGETLKQAQERASKAAAALRQGATAK